MTPRRVAWQARRARGTTVVLRGRRATNAHLPSCVHTYIHTYIHYIHSFLHSFIQTYIHTYVHAYFLFTYFHTLSFTTSFVFPSFPVPARNFEAQYWKKLTCGVIQSFNYLLAFVLHQYKWLKCFLSVVILPSLYGSFLT